MALGMLCDKVEKIPLRHQSDKAAARWQMGKIGNLEKDIADLGAERPSFLMRPLQKIIKEAELMDDFERRGVNRVAAEITQEVCVLFKNEHRHPGSSQQETEHHPCRAAAGDAAAHRNFTSIHSSGLPRFGGRTASLGQKRRRDDQDGVRLW